MESVSIADFTFFCLVDTQNTGTNSKQESLYTIDTFKKYCTERDAPGNVRVMLHQLERGLMAMGVRASMFFASIPILMKTE